MTHVQMAEAHDMDIMDLAHYTNTYGVEIDAIRNDTVDQYWREWLAQKRAEFVEEYGVDPLKKTSSGR